MFKNADITKAVDFAQEVLEDTYVDMEIELPIYGEGPEFYKVTKLLRGSNSIPIVRHH